MMKPRRPLALLRQHPLRPLASSLRTRLHPPPRLHRTMISAPTANSGPIMERRPDRALPEIPNHSRRWLRTAPIFVAVCVVSCLAIFNYQKASSAVVNATLYSLRTHPRARELLGDEIYFRDRFPWIWGEMNQLHGRIDIGFGVKGTVGRGYMKFRSFRRSRMGYFKTEEWSLEMEDGTTVPLLQEENDPYGNAEQERKE